MPSGAVDLVPLGASECDVCGTANVRQTRRSHRARDQLHISGMTQDPRGGHARLRKSVLLPNLGQLSVELGEILVVNEATLEKSVLEGRPRLNCDILEE